MRKSIHDLVPGIPDVDPLELQRIKEAEEVAKYKQEIANTIVAEMNEQVKTCALSGLDPRPVFEGIRQRIEMMLAQDLSDRIKTVDELMIKFTRLYEQVRRDSIVASQVSQLVDLMMDNDVGLDDGPGFLPRG